jgi:hypothetical protein
VGSVVVGRGGDVLEAGEAGESDREVAEGGHRAGSGAGPHVGGIFVVSDVADVVTTRLQICRL